MGGDRARGQRKNRQESSIERPSREEAGAGTADLDESWVSDRPVQVGRMV